MTTQPDPIPYRVEMSETAQKTARELADPEWEPIRRNIARVAELAGRLAPPPKQLLEVAGFRPPVFRLPAGRHVVLYDFRHEARLLYVMAIIRTASKHLTGKSPDTPARAA